MKRRPALRRTDGDTSDDLADPPVQVQEHAEVVVFVTGLLEDVLWWRRFVCEPGDA